MDADGSSIGNDSGGGSGDGGGWFLLNRRFTGHLSLFAYPPLKKARRVPLEDLC